MEDLDGDEACFQGEYSSPTAVDVISKQLEEAANLEPKGPSIAATGATGPPQNAGGVFPGVFPELPAKYITENKRKTTLRDTSIATGGSATDTRKSSGKPYQESAVDLDPKTTEPVRSEVSTADFILRIQSELEAKKEELKAALKKIERMKHEMEGMKQEKNETNQEKLEIQQKYTKLKNDYDSQKKEYDEKEAMMRFLEQKRLYSENGDVVTLRSSIREDDDLNVVQYNKNEGWIGGGCKADVYKGHKVLSKVKVAIKKMNWEGITQEKAKEEVKLLEKAGKGCDFVVKYMFAIKESERLFIIMDYFDTSLYHLLLFTPNLAQTDFKYIMNPPSSAPIPIPPKDSLGYFEKQDVYRSILCQAMEGLAHLHSHLDSDGVTNTIIHRDIKPQNILLRFDGGAPHKIRAVIADFGLSKEAPGDSASLSANQWATMGWTAPEILLESESEEKKKKNISSKVDVFLMGCVMHFVLTEGKHPFGDPADVRSCRIRENVDPIVIPQKGGVGELILDMIRREPDDS